MLGLDEYQLEIEFPFGLPDGNWNGLESEYERTTRGFTNRTP